MKTIKSILKTSATVLAILAFSYSSMANATSNNGIGKNNGATVTHSANVNNNNNGHAGEGNNGNGYGNNPYGNQGNTTSNGRAAGNRSNDSIPLDGGLSILLASAAFFGIKKLRGNKN